MKATARALLLVAVGLMAACQDSPHFNVRYVKWKHRAAPFDRELVHRFLKVDYAFQKELVGKRRDELDAWFPVIRAPGASEWVVTEEHILRRYPGFLWVLEPDWGVDVADDRVRAVVQIKG